MFTLPGLGWEMQSYGLLLALALVLAWVVMLALGRRDRLPPGPLGTAYVLGVGLGLVAARIAWLLQRPGAASVTEPFALRADELAPFVGVMVAGLVAGLHVMRRRVPVVAFFDVAAPALAAGAMVERLGALLAGTGFGDYAPGLPWAIGFAAGSPAYLEHRRALAGLLPAEALQSLPVHPTQIYAMALAGVALGVGLWLRKRRRFSGQVFLGTAIAYLLGRALVEEWFRADAGAATLGPLNASQVSALSLVGVLGVVLWARGKQAAQRPDAFVPWEGGRWSPAEPRDGRSPAPGREPARGGVGAKRTSDGHDGRSRGGKGGGKGSAKPKKRKGRR
jgi:phosphatidylglycerol---prolipoprotein diacylglyceryl transferase